MILDFLHIYIGQAPDGYEFLEYIVSSQLLVFVVWSILHLFASIVNLFKAGK